MKIVVGLGNPGKRYQGTRHNIGFDVLDALARRAGVRFRRKLLAPAQTAALETAGGKLLLVKPLTFMNRSGNGLRPLVRRQGASPADVIVVLDDLDLEAGRLRLRAKGGAGGHKGLQSVIAALETEAFPRVRLGIGPRPAGEELTDFVLARFAPAERGAVERAVAQAAEAVWCMAEEGVDKAMNRFNARQE